MEILPHIKTFINTHRPIKREIRFLYQRLTRGWDDSDTFDLDYALAKLILPRLERFKELTIGHPASMAEEEWNNIIAEMVWGFRWLLDGYEKSFNEGEYKSHEAQRNRAEAAFKLFGEYYLGLWW